MEAAAAGVAITTPTTMTSSIPSFSCRITSLSHLRRDRQSNRLGLLRLRRQHNNLKVFVIKATAQDDNGSTKESEIATPTADENKSNYTTAEAPDFLNTFPEPIRAFLKMIFSLVIGIWKRIQIASVVFEKADVVAERVEDIADKVGDAAREIAEDLPDNAPMKGVVLKVQNIAEQIEEGADNIDNVLDRITDSIDEMEDKIEDCMEEADKKKKEDQDSGNSR